MNWVWHHKSKPVEPSDWNTADVHPQVGRLESLYAWERRCRGYDLFAQPVAVEPAFTPFLPGSIDAADLPQPQLLPAPATPRAYFALRLPSEQKVTPAFAESWLGSLRGLSHPLSFEIMANAEEITFQVSCSAYEMREVRASFQMHFPLSEMEEGPDLLRGYLEPLMEAPIGYQVVDFGLLHFTYLPLQRFTSFAVDPLSRLIAALSQVQAGEVAGVQVLLAGTRSPWSDSLQRLAGEFGGSGSGGHTRSSQSEHLHGAGAKLSNPLFACVLRVFGISHDGDERAFDLCRQVGRALDVLADPGGNALLALDDSGYPDDEHLLDVLRRESRRSGMLLSARELAGVVHPPSEKLLHPKLVRLDTSEVSLSKHLAEEPGVLLGLCRYRSREQAVPWPDRFRTRHCYLLGATRMGKSTLMLNLIAQDMEEGRGLCLIDPHGDLAKDVLALVPAKRAGDVLYLDFSDAEHPVAMGLLTAHSEWEKRLVCSDLLSVLHRLFASSWGDRLEHILRHVLLTLLAEPGHTLRDIRPLLANKAYRDRVLQSVTDPELLSFWRGEFAGYPASTFSPLYNKLGLLLSSPTVRNVIAQKQSRLDIAEVIAQKKVLIVNLSSSLIGEDNAHFLGALLVSKIQIAAMHGLREGRASRVPFTLYVDEFQHFVVSSFEKILSEAGKAGLSLVMANQFLEQLSERLQSAILGNAGTMVAFRVSSDSARSLEKEFAGRFSQEEIVSLKRGEALARLGSSQDSVRLFSFPPPEPAGQNLSAAIISRTREECCRLRTEVEAEIVAEQHRTEEQTREKETKPSGNEQQPEESRGEAEASYSQKSRSRKRAQARSHNVGTEDGVQEGVSPDNKAAATLKATQDEPLLEPEMFGLPDEERL